jgi:hypothetical protein
MPISMPHKAVAILVSAVVSACMEQTSVQKDYVLMRDECQLFAEGNINRFMTPDQGTDIRVRNAKLVTLFSDCMFEHGWTVATPKREEDDLPELNDVPAVRAATAAASSAPSQALDPNRRAPADQFNQE